MTVLSLPGKVDANHKLVIAVGASTADSGGGTTGAVGVLANLRGKVDASGSLVVKVV